MKNNVPIFALLIGYAGAITNVVTEAKSVIGFFAAAASLIASLYAIVISHRRLKTMKPQNPFALGPQPSRLPRKSLRRPLLRQSNSGRPLRLKPRSSRKHIAHYSLLTAFLFLALSGCATNAGGKASPVARLASLPARFLDAATTLVTATTTNIVEEAVVTATDVVTLDPLAHTPVTNTSYATNFTLVTDITAVPKSVIVKTIDTAQTASGFLPPPYGEATAGGLALVSTLLAAAVRRRNVMLKTVIHGVEKSGSAEAKSEISDRAMENGVFPDLHALVKKLTVLVFVAATLTVANAQSATSTEGQSIGILFDHTEHYSIKAYTNGVPFRLYALNEVVPMPGATNTYRIILPPLARGTLNLTLTAIDTNGIESDQSLPLTLQIKHRPPASLRKDK